MKTLSLTPPQTPFEMSVQTALQQVQVPDAGSTINRPLLIRFPGQVYFDTTLGKPVWWNGGAWVDAMGTPV